LIVYGYDSAGRLNSIATNVSVDLSGNSLISTAFSGLTYFPGGQLASASLGIDPVSQVPAVSLVRTLDNRGRITSEVDQSSAKQNLYSYSVGYDGAGNVTSYNDSVAGVWTVKNDALHRFSSSSGTYNGKASAFQATYDHFGNRNVEYFTYAGVQNQPSPYLNFPTGNNRTATYVYDNAGNVLSDGTNNYLYDAEGRNCAVQQITSGNMIGYVYSPDGTRFGKGTISKTFSCDFTKNGMLTTNGLALTTAYNVAPNGDLLEETDGNFNLRHFNVFLQGKLLGTFAGTTYSQANWSFALNDWLGTKRQLVNSGAGTTSYFSGPFGDYLAMGGTGSDPSDQHFTGKERDAESGLDYFGARYYASTMGRFMSPDWAAKAEPVPYAKLENPQTLNLYAYVGNNPLSRTDPTGHYVCNGSKDQCAAIQTGLNLAKTAMDKLGADSKGGQAIGKVLSFYGAAGEKNGGRSFGDRRSNLHSWC
jgi:RHS repeat-associated protein